MANRTEQEDELSSATSHLKVRFFKSTLLRSYVKKIEDFFHILAEKWRVKKKTIRTLKNEIPTRWTNNEKQMYFVW
jgi:hypothetical protein